MGKNAKEEKLVYERPKLVELDTPSASGDNNQLRCDFGSVDPNHIT
jgi:hypothetical protein